MIVRRREKAAHRDGTVVVTDAMYKYIEATRREREEREKRQIFASEAVRGRGGLKQPVSSPTLEVLQSGLQEGDAALL